MWLKLDLVTLEDGLCLVGITDEAYEAMKNVPRIDDYWDLKGHCDGFFITSFT